MRRWNGWGDSATVMELPEQGTDFLRNAVGSGCILADASLAEVIAQVPPSRLPTHAKVSIDAQERVRHARGQSLPDWLAMRSGDFGVFPDGVAFPESAADIRELLAWAAAENILVIAYGGGTSVVGHINPQVDTRAVLTVSLARMNQLIDFDEDSLIATFGPGANGPQVENQLRARGYTLGHFPQSWELSTLGGWVASRSSGQQSLGYGHIEQLFVGGEMETFAGTWILSCYPASAAGPDLRGWVMGSEGCLGIISQVKVRVSRLPDDERFYGVFLPSWQYAQAAMRELSQARIPLSMLRLSNPLETTTQLALAGHPRMITALERYLAWRGCAQDKCLLIFGVTGNSRQNALSVRQTKRRLKRHGAVLAGQFLGKKWQQGRFRFPYLREALWKAGYVVDTLETATQWGNVQTLMEKVEQSLRDGLAAQGEKVHVFSHLSHVYGQGSSIYSTYVFRCGVDYAQTLNNWRLLKNAASQTIADHQGGISHQYGVGCDHAPWLAQEKGELGIAAIQAVLDIFDPQQQLAPGVLLMDKRYD